MAGKSAILTIKILSDASKAGKGLDQAASKSQKFQQGVSKGAKVGGVALLALGAAATKATLAAEEVASANARVGQTLKNAGMGDATDRVLAFAKAQEQSLGIDEKTIKSTQAKLATFHSLAKSADTAGGAFDRATLAAQDMAAAGFGDAESNAVQLGKALEDPIKGLTALNKSGVNFSDAQKKVIQSMVDSGDAAGAQAKILDGVESQVKGTAKATADSSAKMKLAWADVAEQVGSILLPIMDKVAPVVAGIAATIASHSGAFVALGAAIAVVAAAIIALNVALKAYKAVQTAITAATKLWAAAQWLVNAAMTANPIGLIIAGIVAFIAIIVVLWNKCSGFKAFVLAMWKAIQVAGAAAWKGIQAVIKAVIAVVKAYITVYKAVVLGVWSAIRTAASAAWSGIKAAIHAVVVAIKAYITAYKAVVLAVWSAIRTAASAAWSGIKAIVGAVTGVIRAYMRALGTVWSAVWSAIKAKVSAVSSSIKAIVRSMRDAINTAFRAMRDVATAAFNAIKWPIDKIKSAIDSVIGTVERLIGKLKSIHVPKISIPNPFKATNPTAAITTPAMYAATRAGAGAGASSSSSSSSRGPTFIIQGAIDPVGVARQIRQILGADERRRRGVQIGRATA